MRDRSSARAAVAAALVACLGCGDDDDGHALLDAGSDAAQSDASLPPRSLPPLSFNDSGAPFVPPDAPPSIPAVPEPPPDAAAEPDAAPPTPGSVECLRLERGETIERSADLAATNLWRRIEADASCPAQRLTSVEAAYDAYDLCASAKPRVLEITMRGADGPIVTESEALADPLLAVYANESQLRDDPFACLAANDDGAIDGFVRTSARISGFLVPAGTSVVVVASSHEPPSQRGLGAYELTLTAQ